MSKRDLIIHIPVIHKGYLDFFNTNKKQIRNIYIIHEDLLARISPFKPDIASIESSVVQVLLRSMGYENILILRKSDIKKLKDPIFLVVDEISREFQKKCLSHLNIKWVKIFLRWDSASILTASSVNSETSSKLFDKKMMKEAYIEAEKSSDWWRQVGAIVVKNKKIILRAYNQGIPSDHTPYQVGAIRDFLKPGERPDLVSTIHAEQQIISEAARTGISLKGTSLYITHFPCSVCAKLIASSGFKSCYFGEGSSNLDGMTSLNSRGVKVFLVRK